MFILNNSILVLHRYDNYVFPWTTAQKEMSLDAHYMMQVRLFKRGNMYRGRRPTHIDTRPSQTSRKLEHRMLIYKL